MNKIPTAKEFLMRKYEVPKDVVTSQCKLEMASMIEFAKLHVEAALKAASEDAEAKYNWRQEIDKESILNAYPLTNIK
jgi:hypothetical protein